VAAVLFCFKRGWRNRISKPLSISLLCLLTAYLMIEEVAIEVGFRQTQTAIRTGIDKLKNQFNDRVDYSLHECADSLAKKLEKPQKFDMEFLQQKAENSDIDEINIFAKDGTLLASNRPAVLKRKSNAMLQEKLKIYLPLLTGGKNFVKEEFRTSISEPDVYVKYVGVPFPDRDAFLQLGYSLQRLLEEFPVFFFPMFNRTSIENEGFFIVTDRTGKIVAPVAGHNDMEGKNITELGLKKNELNAPVEQFFETKFFGKFGQCCRSDDLGEWRIYAFLPYTEFIGDSVLYLAVSFLTLLIVCTAFRVIMLRAARAQKKIDDMQAADLELARMIQNSELPESRFENDACRIRASMTPAKEVGGDFYDHYVLPDGRVAVTIADVSGKGVPAAIFMMKAKSILKEIICQGSELAACITEANVLLNKNNYAAMFVTAWTGIFNPADGTLRYVSAGHNPPLVLRKNGSLIWLKPERRQKPLAAFAKVTYQEENIAMAPGDRLFLYTDGVTEATDLKLELYGNERLQATLQAGGDDLIGKVAGSLKKFTGTAPVADDITMLT